jgi:predicted flap endonuclease-1-like 5' DNA nuclease
MLMKQLEKHISVIMIAVSLVVLSAMAAVPGNSSSNATRPTILNISLDNAGKNVSTYEEIKVTFSEEMDPSSINEDTFYVMQRAAPGSENLTPLSIDGMISYSNRTATVRSIDGFGAAPNYGNDFAATLTTGVKDVDGDPLSKDHVWNFTTGSIEVIVAGQTIINRSGADQTTSNNETMSNNISNNTLVTGVQTSSSMFPWGWVIGGLALLLLLAYILIPARKPATQEIVQQTHVVQQTHADPFGEVHPVKDIEGIGQEFGDRLNAMGITNTQQLWEANAVNVSEGTDAPVSVVKSWQHMAELASVNDIGPQYAELLERSGVHSIDQLKRFRPNELLRLIQEKQESLKVKIQGNFPGYASVKNWINQARSHKFAYSGGQTA